MRQYRIMVTAVGAVVGYGMVESLRKSKYDCYILGTDIFEDAVGQYFCDEFVQATPAADPHYLDFLKKTIDDYRIDLVLFGIEQELLVVARAGDQLDGYQDKLAVNPPELTEICNDKWLTYLWLKENGLGEYAIDTVISGSFDELAERFGCPFILKPRDGRASKGIQIVDNEEDFLFYKKKMGSSFMAQHIAGTKDNEFTVGVFGDGKGGVCSEIYMRRVLSQAGATDKAEVVNDPVLREAVHAITEKAQPIGPTNYQFRLENGKAKLLEINPRVSASTSIRAKFGFNESEMCIDYYLEHNLPVQGPISSGRAMRYIVDWIVYE
ncbi:MAG: ATP-grasp domain-containing protein [Oscillospiraceae bacterium]|nr:ATP-grasp domain-containing protein [Oscillospiraceae bacterium]